MRSLPPQRWPLTPLSVPPLCVSFQKAIAGAQLKLCVCHFITAVIISQGL